MKFFVITAAALFSATAALSAVELDYDPNAQDVIIENSTTEAETYETSDLQIYDLGGRTFYQGSGGYSGQSYNLGGRTFCN